MPDLPSLLSVEFYSEPDAIVEALQRGMTVHLDMVDGTYRAGGPSQRPLWLAESRHTSAWRWHRLSLEET